MKKVLLGFEHNALIKAITRYVKANGEEDLQFQTVTTRNSALREIQSGEYEVVILMEDIGCEKWSMDEMIQIKDSYAVNLIPIIPDRYKGSSILSKFCNYGITSAVFISEKNAYNVEDVSKLIYRPRILKDARAYYGISSMTDIRSGGNTLDDATYESVRNAIVNGNEPIGVRYINAIGDLMPAQVGELLKRLDEKTLHELKQTVEFYDVLEALKKSKVIRSYHIPRGIKKLRSGKQAAPLEEIVFEPEIIDVTEEATFLEEEEEDEDAFEIKDETAVAAPEGDASDEENDGAEQEEDDFEIVFGEQAVTDGDDDFSFAIRQIKATQQVSKEDEGLMSEEREEREDLEKKEEKKEKPVRRRMGELDDIDDVEEDKKNKKTALIVAAVSAGLLFFFLILLLLFVKISVQRKAAAERAALPQGYNQIYNTDDVAQYRIGENGSVILQDEDGNVLYEGNSSGIDKMGVEEEIDLSVIPGLYEEEDRINQAYNDTSSFEEGKEYKGLDLVNMLNGNGGADCTLLMKNGASVNIKRGDASIEEFKPSAMYTCQIDGSVLYFSEK